MHIHRLSMPSAFVVWQLFNAQSDHCRTLVRVMFYISI